MEIEMFKIEDSKLIHSAGYDEEENHLYIRFMSGRLYIYKNVPEEVYNEMMQAGSKGKYFSENIRKVYDYKEVE